MTLSEEKQFALEILDIFDDLVKPEIKYNWIERFWSFFTGYAKKKIIKKPDQESIPKMF